MSSRRESGIFREWRNLGAFVSKNFPARRIDLFIKVPLPFSTRCVFLSCFCLLHKALLVVKAKLPAKAGKDTEFIGCGRKVCFHLAALAEFLSEISNNSNS